MSNLMDILSPVYIGEDRISVTVDTACLPLTAYKPVMLKIDYTATEPEGVNLPMEIIVQPAFGAGGKSGGYLQKTFTRNRPTSFVFVPPSPGDYLVLVRETAHNEWQGRLTVTVTGDSYAVRSNVRQI